MNPAISDKIHLTKEHCTKLLRMMMLIRRFEERAGQLYGSSSSSATSAA